MLCGRANFITFEVLFISYEDQFGYPQFGYTGMVWYGMALKKRKKRKKGLFFDGCFYFAFEFGLG